MRRSVLLFSVAAAVAAGCSAGAVVEVRRGQTGGDAKFADDGTRGPRLIELGIQYAESGKCDAPTVGHSPLRRISRIEYNNAVRDVFGDTSRPADGFVPEEKVAGFNSNSVAPVSQLSAEQYLDAAGKVAAHVLGNLTAVTGCSATSERACIEAFLVKAARRAFHGTLPADEEATLLADYRAASDAIGVDAGLELGVSAILLSPRFLYLLELGAGDTAIVPLTPHELAGRLAASIWRSVPDEALLAAADANQLGTQEQVESKARRMLADPRAEPMLADFVTQWLGIKSASALQKDSSTFPNFTESLKTEIVGETKNFFVRSSSDGATLGEMLTASYSYGSAALAQFYGASTSSDGSIQLPSERIGLLTHASVLASHSHPVSPSPVLRGRMVRAQLLCDPVSDPPPDVNTTLDDPESGETTRDLFERHATEPRCAECHERMDPIGFGFNHFDAIGDFVGESGGSNEGEIVTPGSSSAPDISGAFQGPRELAQKLSESTLVHQCYTVQTLRYALGREEVTGDACAAKQAWDRFVESGFQVHEAILGLVTSDAFRFRTEVEPGGACE